MPCSRLFVSVGQVVMVYLTGTKNFLAHVQNLNICTMGQAVGSSTGESCLFFQEYNSMTRQRGTEKAIIVSEHGGHSPCEGFILHWWETD